MEEVFYVWNKFLQIFVFVVFLYKKKVRETKLRWDEGFSLSRSCVFIEDGEAPVGCSGTVFDLLAV